MESTSLYINKSEKPAKIFVYSAAGTSFERQLPDHLKIGRSSAETGHFLKITSPIVSRVHGEFVRSGGTFWYRDLGSTNGTYINGILYGKDAPDGRTYKRLESGDILRVELNGMSSDKSVIIIFTTDYPDLFSWQRLKFDDSYSAFRIGRDGAPGGGLIAENRAVSRTHAVFRRDSDGWIVEDRNSLNGVFVNGSRISSAVRLRDYDVIRIVNLYFIFVPGGLVYQAAERKEPAAEEHVRRRPAVRRCAGSQQLAIHIVRRDVRHHFRTITLLKDIHLTVNDGEMVVVMGGSGAGKTTFLNAVMGYEKADGQIRYGRSDLYSDYEKMKHEIGYVTQENLIRMNDTVYRTLEDAAVMKLPESFTKQQREARIEKVLEQLGLEREKNSLVSKLSGGQKKRLSIAVEYIADPKLFFLDEPDSGLDGVMAVELMNNLRQIADTGKIVIVISHSPDRAFDLFDKVIVLAKGTFDNCGHLAFYGTPSEALRFFDAKDLEHILKKVNRPDEGGEGMSDYFISKYSRTHSGIR